MKSPICKKGDLTLSITKQLDKSNADLFVSLAIANLLDYNLIYDRLDDNNLRHFKVPVRRRKIIFDCNLLVVFLDQRKVPDDYFCALCKKEKSKKKPKISKTFQFESKHIITFHKNHVSVNELIREVRSLEFQSLRLQGFDFTLLVKVIKN